MSALGFIGIKDDRINYGEIDRFKFKVVESDHLIKMKGK